MDSDSINSFCQNNNTASRLLAFRYFQKIFQNIINNPNEEKFKKLLWQKAPSALTRCSGALEIFQEYGFVLTDNTLYFLGEIGLLEIAYSIIEGKIDEADQELEAKRQEIINNTHSKMENEIKNKEKEKNLIKQQLSLDAKERKLQGPVNSCSCPKNLPFGANIATHKPPPPVKGG